MEAVRPAVKPVAPRLFTGLINADHWPLQQSNADHWPLQQSNADHINLFCKAICLILIRRLGALLGQQHHGGDTAVHGPNTAMFLFLFCYYSSIIKNILIL